GGGRGGGTACSLAARRRTFFFIHFSYRPPCFRALSAPFGRGPLSCTTTVDFGSSQLQSALVASRVRVRSCSLNAAPGAGRLPLPLRLRLRRRPQRPSSRCARPATDRSTSAISSST